MIWIMLPAFNEETDLPKLLEKFEKNLANLEYRLVVINDGSTDRTNEILDEFKYRLNLDVVLHPINRGLGETERDGF